MVGSEKRTSKIDIVYRLCVVALAYGKLPVGAWGRLECVACPLKVAGWRVWSGAGFCRRSWLRTSRMWLIYGFIAMVSPVALILARRWLRRGVKAAAAAP